MDYLKADKGNLTEDEVDKIRSQLAIYFPKHINHDFLAILAEVDNQVVSTAFLVLFEKPVNPSFITGKTATILNVLTYPEYRRMGYAKSVLRRIIEEARQWGVASIDLSATPEGVVLYKKLGFVEPKTKYTAMKLQLI